MQQQARTSSDALCSSEAPKAGGHKSITKKVRGWMVTITLECISGATGAALLGLSGSCSTYALGR